MHGQGGGMPGLTVAEDVLSAQSDPHESLTDRDSTTSNCGWQDSWASSK